MPEESPKERFETFKNSFSYGSRNDLNFKFLKALPDDQAADFFKELLWKLVDAFDDGDYECLYKHVYEWQRRGYAGEGKWQYDQAPFTPVEKPISETKVVLIASSGHFIVGDDPEPFGVENMTQDKAIRRINDFLKAAPTLSAIPVDTPQENLCVRHGGYDIRAAQADPNVALPIDRLRELASAGAIGELAPNAYSFVGATSQMKLTKEAGPKWVEMLQEQQVEAAVLIPL
jgi:D-proline reductase (dithiol) PrdB